MHTRLSALALAAAGALALAGCSGAADPGEEPAPSLNVVATTTQLVDFAGEVGGDDIELTGLLAPGGSAHHFDPSPADLLALGEADVLIVNGAGLETFVDDAVESSGFDGLVIDASDGVDLDEAREITLEGEDEDHDHEDHAEDEDHAEGEDHDHADEDHAEEADEHAEDEHDHDHGDLNPHLWSSPRLAQGMVGEIARGLSEAEPDRASDFAQRAEEYQAKLGLLDEWAAAQFERVPEADRVLVSGHDSMRYFLHDYDIEFAGSILPSFEDNAEPSAAEIDELVHEIEEHGVKAIFVESSISPKLAETVAKEAGVRVVDAETLFVDSLGAEGSGAETYIAATVHNTRVILEAWGVTPDPVPAELESV
ncbi:metal ABC transporter substrate-binding protein [Leucobacter weissii]|uniref:metal ABC transporter substrate-binding protein n=1 Tax=Leucobacter weissii TaxID=1983706 RepID=UPI003132CC7E